MAFVPVPKDLNRVKTKVMFNLTKRQIIRICCKPSSPKATMLSPESHVLRLPKS